MNTLTNARSARSSVSKFVCPISFEPSFVPIDGYSGTTAENEPVKVCEIWTSFSGTIEKEDLLFEDQILV